MLTVRIQEKNHSESIMVLKLKDGYVSSSYSKKCNVDKTCLLIMIEWKKSHCNCKYPMII